MQQMSASSGEFEPGEGVAGTPSRRVLDQQAIDGLNKALGRTSRMRRQHDIRQRSQLGGHTGFSFE